MRAKRRCTGDLLRILPGACTELGPVFRMKALPWCATRLHPSVCGRDGPPWPTAGQGATVGRPFSGRKAPHPGLLPPAQNTTSVVAAGGCPPGRLFSIKIANSWDMHVPHNCTRYEIACLSRSGNGTDVWQRDYNGLKTSRAGCLRRAQQWACGGRAGLGLPGEVHRGRLGGATAVAWRKLIQCIMLHVR